MDVRRIADGVKLSLRFKTTEQVERAFVEDRKHQYMYQDADGFHFMNMESYDQVAVPADIVGDQAAYLQPEMEVTISLHEGIPVAIELPPRAVARSRGNRADDQSQTASSSYKPAMLSNGVRTMVPPFVTTGTKIVVMTADGSYVERAKDKPSFRDTGEAREPESITPASPERKLRRLFCRSCDYAFRARALRRAPE